MTEPPEVDLANLPMIALDELRERTRDRKLTILDVLAPESYAAMHIPGAISIPLDELRERAPVELPDRDRDIAVYCSAYT